MKKKFDWNVPMTRKNWVQLYVWCVGIMAAFYALLWGLTTINRKRFRKKMSEEPIQEEDSEDEEPYFDDEE